MSDCLVLSRGKPGVLSRLALVPRGDFVGAPGNARLLTASSTELLLWVRFANKRDHIIFVLKGFARQI